jgi:hypothetical protein
VLVVRFLQFFLDFLVSRFADSEYNVSVSHGTKSFPSR